MATNTTGSKEVGESVTEKRARFERFSMTVLKGAGAGRVNVRNDSYGTEAGEHIYNVRVANGEAVECTCPADEYQSGPCKHRLAVSDRPLVLSSASASANATVATDGGERR